MKPVEATWEGRGVRVRLDRQLRNVCLIFRVLRLVAEALALHPPLDAPAPCACLLNSFC